MAWIRRNWLPVGVVGLYLVGMAVALDDNKGRSQPASGDAVPAENGEKRGAARSPVEGRPQVWTTSDSEQLADCVDNERRDRSTSVPRRVVADCLWRFRPDQATSSDTEFFAGCIEVTLGWKRSATAGDLAFGIEECLEPYREPSTAAR